MDKDKAFALPEIESRRTQNSRHFLRPDGRHQAILSRNLHYKSGGKWKPREDFSLLHEGDELHNDSDDFPIRVRGSRIKVGKDSFEVEGLFLDGVLIASPAAVAPEVSADRVMYRDVFPGIDLEYLITPHRVKESIHLRSNPMVGRFVAGEVLSVGYKVNGSASFRGLWARDAKRLLTVRESRRGSRYLIGLSTADLRTAIYPVEIDPTVALTASSDTTIENGVTRSESVLYYGRAYYNDGKGGGYDWLYRSYLRQDLTSVDAAVSAASFYATFANGRVTPLLVNQSAAEVEPETGDIATVWSSAVGSNIGSIPFTALDQTLGLDITSYAEAHRGGFCDLGLIGNEADYLDPASYVYSSETGTVAYRPYMSVTYGSAGGGTVTGVTAQATGTSDSGSLSALLDAATAAASGTTAAGTLAAGITSATAAASAASAAATVTAAITGATAPATADSAPGTLQTPVAATTVDGVTALATASSQPGTIAAALTGTTAPAAADTAPATASAALAGASAPATADASPATLAVLITAATAQATADTAPATASASIDGATAQASADAGTGTLSALVAGSTAQATADTAPGTTAAGFDGATAAASADSAPGTLAATLAGVTAAATADAQVAALAAAVDGAIADAVADSLAGLLEVGIEAVTALAWGDSQPGEMRRPPLSAHDASHTSTPRLHGAHTSAGGTTATHTSMPRATTGAHTSTPRITSEHTSTPRVRSSE